MTLADFIEHCAQQGLTLTAAMQKLQQLTGTTPRTAWNWYQTGKLPVYAARLMQVWAEASPEQRARWFA